MAAEPSLEKLREILEREGVDNLTAKSARQKLEEAQGLEPGSLKSQKNVISNMLDQLMNEEEEEQDAEEDDGKGDAEEDEEDEEEDEEKKPKKKQKKADPPAAEDENENKGKATCKTKSGGAAPKDLKKMQAKMKMTQAKFLNSKPIEVDICGNILTGQPRTFKSGGLGWYLGGKIEVPLGKETIWCQAGLNITIPGSQDWKK
eukprot:CAMPEP_0119312832 /NCGR_PEP_ID=MMETSP1333-20130426/27037_1 /TAXON_ID=418940 /ORGANISM="Scyphosphaera apsteinii, Strain RCC1455" /LENGTH=202 /DNA_ID=CAMNT_0007317505 /DNA_START=56 /DNA_END=664 /DNA_ORIENTATION=+